LVVYIIYIQFACLAGTVTDGVWYVCERVSV